MGSYARNLLRITATKVLVPRAPFSCEQRVIIPALLDHSTRTPFSRRWYQTTPSCRNPEDEQSPSTAAGRKNTARKEIVLIGDPADLAKEFLRSMYTTNPQRKTIFTAIAKKCETSSDAETVLDILAKYRALLVSRGELIPFSEGLSMALAEACVRGGVPHKVLDTFVRNQELGLPAPPIALKIVQDADVSLGSEEVDSVLASYEALKRKGLKGGVVTDNVASVVLTTLLKGGQTERACKYFHNVTSAGCVPYKIVYTALLEAAQAEGLEDRVKTMKAARSDVVTARKLKKESLSANNKVSLKEELSNAPDDKKLGSPSRRVKKQVKQTSNVKKTVDVKRSSDEDCLKNKDHISELQPFEYEGGLTAEWLKNVEVLKKAQKEKEEEEKAAKKIAKDEGLAEEVVAKEQAE